jgi:tRNA (cmo5U34)-methyltransferase
MNMPHKSPWQQPQIAAQFAHRRQALVPLIGLQEEVVTHVLHRYDQRIDRFLDLGAGSGAMAALIGICRPSCEGVLIDFSEPMLDHARRRLTASHGNWRFLNGDLSSPAWQTHLPGGRYDAIVSGLVIHHLSSRRKRELFAEVLALLEPGGIFLNMDYVAVDGPLRGLFDEQMRANAIRAARERSSGACSEKLPFEDTDDRPDRVEDQLRWLHEAGFQNVEVHFKWAEAAIFGGIKGQTEAN